METPLPHPPTKESSPAKASGDDNNIEVKESPTALQEENEVQEELQPNKVWFFNIKSEKYPIRRFSIWMLVIFQLCGILNVALMNNLLSGVMQSKLHVQKSMVFMFIYRVFSCLNVLLIAIIVESMTNKILGIVFVNFFGILGVGLGLVNLFDIPVIGSATFTFLIIVVTTTCLRSDIPLSYAITGDQLKLPEQHNDLYTYFTIIKFFSYIGRTITNATLPKLKEEIRCFNFKICFPLLYGIAATNAVICVVLLAVAYSHLCKRKNIPETRPLQAVKCIIYALRQEQPVHKPSSFHWLDLSKQKFNPNFVEEIKSFLRLVCLFLPTFFANGLLSNLGDIWYALVYTLSGHTRKFEILQEQVNTFAPLTGLILILLFHFLVFPAWNKRKFCVTPIQRMALGMLLCSVAYLIAAYTSYIREHYSQFHISDTHDGLCEIRFYNPTLCEYKIDAPEISPELFVLEEMNLLQFKNILWYKGVNFSYFIESSCGFNMTGKLNVGNKDIKGVFFDKAQVKEFNESFLIKSHALVTLISSIEDNKTHIVHLNSRMSNKEMAKFGSDTVATKKVKPGSFVVNDKTLSLSVGQVVVFLLHVDKNSLETLSIHEVYPPFPLTVLILIPQFVILVLADILFSVSGMYLSYTQAAPAFKTIAVALNYFLIGLGYLSNYFIQSRSEDFGSSKTAFICSLCVLISMIIFSFIGYWYKYTLFPTNPQIDG